MKKSISKQFNLFYILIVRAKKQFSIILAIPILTVLFSNRKEYYSFYYQKGNEVTCIKYVSNELKYSG
ncbi:MAG: hypothetical protein GQ564_02840 [Bacteroidales bacterium]|nr:hypothetical protein [Bacteroidales bacterium]